MKLSDRYGQIIQVGDIILNCTTGNLLKVVAIDDLFVSCCIVDNPFSPTFRIPTSHVGADYAWRSDGTADSEGEQDGGYQL